MLVVLNLYLEFQGMLLRSSGIEVERPGGGGRHEPAEGFGELGPVLKGG